MVIVSGLVAVYFNVIICWVLYYFAMSFNKILPWSDCNNEWNTANCLVRISANRAAAKYNGSELIAAASDNLTSLVTSVYSGEDISNATEIIKNHTHTMTPAEEFWE